MLVLGIETSCDETAIAVVEKGIKILSNVVASSLKFHQRYRGIVPEIASRKHLETISTVLIDALRTARVSFKDIDLIAITQKPGLPGSLLVGICFAEALSVAQKIPLIPIDHLQAHLWAAFLGAKPPLFPFVGLVVSGGHTSLFYVRRPWKVRLLGSTRDDACGEAFDKVASILGLGYPGGPLVEKAALRGNPAELKFNCGNTQRPLDFSFSGIKTAVLYYVRSRRDTPKKRASSIADIAACFQEAVLETLVEKSVLACRMMKTRQLVIGGGVAANNRLREKFSVQAGINRLKINFSAKEFCTDNAAMVAGLGYRMRTSLSER